MSRHDDLPPTPASDKDLLRLAVDGARLGTWRWDARRRLCWADAEFLRLWGVPPTDEHLPVSALTGRLAPEGAAALDAMQAREIAPGEEHDLQLEIVSGPAAGHWLRWRGRAAQETPWIIDGICFDVTERKRAEIALRANEQRMRRQKEAFQAAIDGAPLAESLGILARIVTEETAGEARTAFYIADRDSVSLHPIRGAGDMSAAYAEQVDGWPIGADSLSCGLAIAAGRPVLTRDVFEEPRWRPWPRLAAEHGFRGCWSFPIATRDGKPVGTFAMYWPEAREATADDLARADAITQAAAIIIARHGEAEDRALAEDALRQSEAHLAIELADARHLQQISSSPSEENVETLYHRILDTARALMRSDMASIQRLSPERQSLVLLAQHGFAPESAAFWAWVDADRTTSCGVALARGEPIVVPDVEQWDLVAGTQDLAEYRRCGIRAMLATPLVARDGRLVGVMSTHWRETHHPSPRETRLLDVLARQAADLLEWRAAEEALRASEEKYRTLFETMEQGYCELELLRDADGRAVDHRYLELNPAFERLSGIPVAEAQGRTASEVLPELEPWWHDAFDRIAKRGEPERIAYEVASLGRWFEVLAYPRGGDRLTVLYEDVTERKRAEEALRASEERQTFLLKLSDALRPLDDAAAIQTAASRVVGEWLNADRSYYAAVEPDGATIVIPPGHFMKPGVLDITGRYPMASFDGALIDALRANRPIVIADTQADARLSERERAAHASIDVRAYAAFPLVKAGRLVAAFGALMASPRAWTADEAAVIGEAAERTWAAVERAHAEARLRASEETFRTFVSATSDVVYRMSADWRVMQHLVGKAFIATTADPREDWLESYIPEADRQAVRDTVDRAIRTKSVFELEHRVVRLDGAIGWTFSRAVPMFDEAGEIVAWLGAARDITGRKRADLALRESEARFRGFAENSTDTLWIVDADTRQLEYLSPAFERMWGEPREAVMADLARWAELVHPDDRAAAAEALPRGLAGETAVTEYRIVRPDGEVRWINDTGFPIRDEAGEARFVAGIAQDVTERKRAEAALRDSEARYRTLFASMDEGLCIIEKVETAPGEPIDFRYTDANPAFTAISGISEVIGRTSRELVPDVDDDWLLTYDTVLRTGEPIRFERELVPLDIVLNLYAFPLIDEGRRRLAVIFTDVTQRRRDEAALRESEAMLAARVAAATEELRSLSRRLLTVQEEERRNLARELHDEIGQALTALQLLLNAAGPDGNGALPEARAIVRELTARVSEMSMNLRPAALDTLGLLPTLLWHVDRYQTRTGVHVDLRRDGLDRRFPSDIEIAAYRVVQEALTNVARHAGAAAATVYLLADAEALTVAIRDEGRGFDPDRTAGAGGLSGMRERVDRLGGTLSIDAAPGAGVTVTAELPLDGARGAEGEP